MAETLTTQEHIARARLLGYTGYAKAAGTYFKHGGDDGTMHIDALTLKPVTFKEYWDRLEHYNKIHTMGDEAKR